MLLILPFRFATAKWNYRADYNIGDDYGKVDGSDDLGLRPIWN
jgi:hypothetical protein